MSFGISGAKLHGIASDAGQAVRECPEPLRGGVSVNLGLHHNIFKGKAHLLGSDLGENGVRPLPKVRFAGYDSYGAIHVHPHQGLGAVEGGHLPSAADMDEPSYPHGR